MNTNPNAIKILCYGDSNTWGQKPDRSGRYGADVRWTGVLQNLLGQDYYVIEEGLGGRTVNLDNPDRIGRNGKTYLAPCLQSHNPINVIVIMLGTNDLKISYDVTPNSVVRGLSGLVDDVYEYTSDNTEHKPHILLISPLHIVPTSPRFTEFYSEHFDQNCDKTSQELAGIIEKLCLERDLLFLDSAKYVQAGEDGLHFDLDSNAKLAKAIAATIGGIYK